MRERKLERIALVVRIHDGRKLVGEVLVEIFEQRANREQLRRDVFDTPIELGAGIDQIHLKFMNLRLDVARGDGA